MKSREEIIEKLKQNEVHTEWEKELQWRHDNRYWIKYSQMVAVEMLSRMSELNLSEEDVAAKLGRSINYVSRILKGNENLSLKTMAKIEIVLGLSFFNHPYYNNVNYEEH